MSSPKILILGGTGMLGHKLFQHMRSHYSGTLCTMQGRARSAPYNHIPLLQSNDVIDGIDAYRFQDLEKLLLSLKPQWIVNCIGVIKQRLDTSQYLAATALNAVLPHRLAQLSAGWGGRLVHFSTDCVFSGCRGMYKEDDPSDADDLYGRTKYLGETKSSNALTLRTSIIGRELANHQSLLDWFLLNQGGRIQGYRKSIYSGLTTNHLAEVVDDIIDHHSGLNGVYQVVSEPISKYDLLCHLREAYAMDITIEPVEGEQVNRSMEGSKFRAATGYVCPSWANLAEQLAKDPTPYDRWLRPARAFRRSTDRTKSIVN